MKRTKVDVKNLNRPRAEFYVPTPEQIAAVAKQIREGWTREERVKRKVGITTERPG